MKQTIALIFVLFLKAILFAQEKKIEPFIIQGQITNLHDKQLFLAFRNEFNNLIADTIPVAADGKFYLKTFKVTKPCATQFNREGVFLAQLFIAPSYNLILTGDLKDGLPRLQNKKVSGIGSTINKYSFIADEHIVDWMKFNEQNLLTFIKDDQRFKDSLYHIFFDKKQVNDRYFGYFKRRVQFDNIFQRLYYLTVHVDDNKSYSYEKSVNFVKENFNKDVLNNLYNEEYLISSDYRNVLLNEYPLYLRTLNCRKDSSQCDNKKYWTQVIKKVADNYKGKIKDMTMKKIMLSSLQYCRSFEEINNYKELYPQYIAQLGNTDDRNILNKLLADKGNELAQTQIGKHAPAFTAQDTSGKTYSFNDFKGKVVYIDLWGSWCGPCRELTPFYKTLYEKYKNDNRIVCVSISIGDNLQNWKNALREDKPTWLQLLDNNGIVQSSYVANSVPKFVVINKEGNIVTFDAPMPDQVKEITKILDTEIAK